MSVPYKNPITPLRVQGGLSIDPSLTFGNTFSVYNVGGFMEVGSLNDLVYTIPTGTTGSIEYSGNTIPIEFTKGTGTAWSPDVLTLYSDNISSGRRRVGMLVYVLSEDQTYQYNIDNYDSLWSAATASTGTVVISDFGTTVNNSTAAGQNFINAWTGSTIEGVNGVSRKTANWRKYYRTQQFINNLSTGLFYFTGITLTSLTTFSVSPVKGWVVNNESDTMNPTITYVEYSGQTGLTTPYLSSATITYISLTSGGTITLSSTAPTTEDQRKNIYLGKIGHANLTSLIQAFNEPDYVQSPISQLRDMFEPIQLINSGVYPSSNGANLNFNTSAGNLYGLGINYINNLYSPNNLTIGGQSPATFQYRTQTGGTTANVTLIDPTKYDNGGVITTVGGGTNNSTNQRIFLTQNGTIRVQYGQQIYSDLPTAIAAANTESFVTFSNFRDNAVLIGILSVRHTATNLSSTSQARFLLASKFGETIGASGGISTTTLQQAYNNSSTPEIVTDGTLGAVSIKNGTGNADNVTNLLEGQNTAGTTTSFIRADGLISGSTISTPGFTANTNGLTATTVSATTYYNLPVSGLTQGSNITITNNGSGNYTISSTGGGGGGVTTTGGTYSYGTATFTNSTGGTFNVTGFTKYFVTGSTPTGYTLVDGDRWFDTNSGLELVWITDGDGSQWVQPTQGGGGSSTGNYLPLSGGTVTGGTIFTAGLTANTISATTYQNLPFSGTVGGTGTSNYVTKWSDGIDITDSLIYDTGAFVGIGTTTPIYSEPISFQTSNRGITIDSLYIQENSNGSLAFATGFDYNSWGTNGSEIAIGTRGPLENSTGSGNIGIGDKALNANTTGTNNIAIGGTSTLFNNSTGTENTAIGNNSLQFNNDGQQNVSIGNDSLFNNINGDRNTILGHSAGYTNLGSNNVYLGFGAGYSNDGSNNIFIGYSAGGSDTSSSNKLNIGDTIIGDLSAKSISVPTISATTYQNLPSQSGTGVSSLSFIPTTGILTLTKNDTTTLTAGTFTYITGGSYSNNIVTLTNNLGGNSTLTINTLTGLTINGGLTVTTISATTYQNLPFSGTVTGSGTTRYIPSWNSVSNLVNSIIYNATDKIGINTSLPSATLHVSGDTIISSGLTATTIIGNSLTLSNSASTISLNNPTQQQIKFFSGGTGTPTYNSYSSGAKIIFSDNISSISSGFAIGVDAGTLWYGADLSGNGHDWYAGTRKLASLVPSTGFQLIGLGSSSDAAFTISGNTVGFSKGGAGYTDFLRVINNATGATNTNKWFRMNSTGGIEILNSVYTATIFSLSDNGIMAVGGGNLATTSSNDAQTNYLTFGSNNTQIYDDGNTHIHSRSSNQSMWINTNGGQINIGTQSTVSGGALASAITMGSSTVAKAYLNVYGGKTYTIGTYGYLFTGGAGTGGGTTATYGIYTDNRIEAVEFDATSDERLKNIEGNIQLNDAINLVNNIKPIKFTWKNKESEGVKAGYSAQQVVKSGFGHLVSQIKNEELNEVIDNDGFTSPKGMQLTMSYDQVTPYHGVVIKHLLEKIEQLESRIKDLENK